jgi:ribosomal protein S18 acetylase RimI-like enzyme
MANDTINSDCRMSLPQIIEVAPSESPMDLLLLADPCVEKINGYLPDARCFVVYADEAAIGACVVKQVANNAYELMNIAVTLAQQQNGIGTRLLNHVIEAVGRMGAERLHVGTGTFGHQLAFYQRQGFRVVGVDQDFFLRNYPEPIVEAGIQLKDMLRLTLEYPARAAADDV